jgi:hypothetical protein
MKYNSIHGNIVGGTRNYGIPGAYLDLSPVGKGTNKNHTRMTNGRGANGSTKLFVITIDPQGLYSLGVSSFTLADVSLGIKNGAFSEGTEFMSPDGRVRIMGGKLKYAKNKALYKLPELRV